MTSHPIRLLAIDLRQASPALRHALLWSATELDELVRRVRREARCAELVVVSDAERFEIYSTEVNHVPLMRSVLRELSRRAGESAELGELHTIQARGAAVAEHLMRLAVGLAGCSGIDKLAALNLAFTRSRGAGTLGPELSALFTTALEAGWRAYCETPVSDPTRSQPERDVALLEAERIVEEALVVWKAKRERVRTSRHAVPFAASYYRRYGRPSVPIRAN